MTDPFLHLPNMGYSAFHNAGSPIHPTGSSHHPPFPYNHDHHDAQDTPMEISEDPPGVSNLPVPTLSTTPYPSSFPSFGEVAGLESTSHGDRTFASSSAPSNRKPRGPRSKYGNLNWDTHRELLKRMYIDENLNLAAIIKIMSEEHSFTASRKLYNEKFKEWGLHKNLPARHVPTMAAIAKKRKRETKKDTVFIYGDATYTSERVERSLSRLKQPRNHISPRDLDTPKSFSYKTPKALHAVTNSEDEMEDAEAVMSSGDGHPQSPSHLGVINEEAQDNSNGFDQNLVGRVTSPDSSEGFDTDTDDIDESEPEPQVLPLSCKGLTRGDLLALRTSAQSNSREGNVNEAEKKYLQVIEGFRYLLGPAHVDATNASYALASLYAENDRMGDADEVIEDVTRLHIETLGYHHARTQQHVMHAVELLNSWNRHQDALGLLAHAEELLEGLGSGEQSRRRRSDKGKQNHMASSSSSLLPHTSGLAGPVSLPVATNDPQTLDVALSVTRPRVTAIDSTIEKTLAAIITTCKHDPVKFLLQRLKAQSQLLTLYQKLETVDDHANVFEESEDLVASTFNTYNFDRDKFESFEVLEACLQLATSMLKANYAAEAGDMYTRAIEKASRLFGNNDERTVWIAISIGLVYQRCTDITGQTWDEGARNWFERAFAAALSAWDEEDGIVKSLQRALDIKQFKYLNDEGRPFRTVFGVSGIKITPGRLHIG